MTDRFILSEDGLTRCTTCRRHVVGAERPSLTECPFCRATLSRGARIRLPVGRSGMLAASLLAFSAIGCGGEEAATEPAHMEVPAEEAPEVAEPEVAEPEVAEPAEPEVAEPEVAEPEVAEPSVQPAPVDPQAETVQLPTSGPAIGAYGAPPIDRFERPDTRPVPAPRYGLAPSRLVPPTSPIDDLK